MTTASPNFSMNGGGSLAKLTITAAGAITATLDSVNGVKSVTWAIVRTDDTSSPSDYTLIQSGSVGQTVTFNALGLGTAGILQAEINGGISNRTDQPSSDTRAQAKFNVLTSVGLEVFVQDEFGDKQEPDRTADPDFGGILPLNQLVRTSGSFLSNSSYLAPVRLATASALPANTRSGNVLTADANGAIGNIDGVAVALNDRVLIKDEATGANRGVFQFNDLGSGASPWQATRTTDFDEDTEVVAGTLIPVEEGTTYADTLWILSTNNPITVNTTALIFSLIGGAGDQVLVNSVNCTSGADLNDTLPAAVGNGVNVKWQRVGTDPDSVSAYMDSASVAVKGVIELASQAQVDAGTDTTKAVTSSTLQNAEHVIHDNVADEINDAPTKATPVGADIVLAEDSENNFAKFKCTLTQIVALATGTGDDMLVNAVGVTNAGDLNDTTPAAVGAGVNVKWQRTGTNPDSVSAYMQESTEGQKGVSERATQAEVDAGTDDERHITPAKLAASALGGNWFIDVQTLTANLTITNNANSIHILDATGGTPADRTVQFPAEANWNKKIKVVFNSGDQYHLICQDDTPAVKARLGPKEVGIFTCNGTTVYHAGPKTALDLNFDDADADSIWEFADDGYVCSVNTIYPWDSTGGAFGMTIPQATDYPGAVVEFPHRGGTAALTITSAGGSILNGSSGSTTDVITPTGATDGETVAYRSLDSQGWWRIPHICP